MKTKIIHPLWIHLPAVFVILALIITTLLSGPLPGQAPIHFDSSGQPDSYGSPLIVIIMILLMMVLFLAISGMIDELWARQEKKKTFNWLSLFDDFIVGGLGGVTIGYLGVLSESTPVFEFPWVQVVLVCGLATILAVILEVVRPYRKYEFAVIAENIDGIESDIDNIVKSGQPLVYWESQNPIYNSILAVAAGIYRCSPCHIFPGNMGQRFICRSGFTQFYDVRWFQDHCRPGFAGNEIGCGWYSFA